MSKGLRINRRFTEAGTDPYERIEWSRRDSRITNPDGSVVFEMTDAEIPARWSQVASDIMVSKYFRKAGVPQYDETGTALLDESGEPVLGPERSARQVFDRLAGTWRHWGEKYGYFASSDDADAFEDEMKWMLANQMGAPNSPQWFNTGLHHSYGLTGPAQGFWFVDNETGEMTESPDSYSHPAPHACFPEGTLIMTRSGSMPIEKIEPGDQVLTHQGRFRAVSETMQRQVEEDLIRIRVSKLTATELRATANHPVLAIRGKEARRRFQGHTPQPDWIEAGELAPGDYVVIASPPVMGHVPFAVDLADYCGPNFDLTEDQIITRNSQHHPTMNRFLSFEDPSIMRLLGRWLGDGSIGHETRDGQLASVNFVFNSNDRSGIDDVASLMEKHFGVSTTTEFASGQHTADLRYTRRPLARWFFETFGEGFATKTVPGWVLQLPRQHLIELLVGLFASDGCVLNQGNSKSLCFDHSNRQLAEAVWRIARSLGYSPALIGGSVRPGGTTPHYRVQVAVRGAAELAEACGVEVPAGKGATQGIRIGEHLALRIKSIEAEPFFGTVYNFQVEDDESYVANGVVVHNCFILGVKDDLVNPGGIMDLWVREARIFKFGSGAGSNFSAIRAENERLSGGGKSSGVMSFLKIGDRAAGAIKSGGTTRRAAKMVILDVDHPDIENFVNWKKAEEEKAKVLIGHGGFPADFNGEAYATVSGQNSNNSVRVTNDFIEAVLEDRDWDLINRTDGSVRKTIKARDLWTRIADAAWACADPGLQFDTTINEWHTSPAGGPIRASNPCFTGEMRVATDKGLIPFKSLVTRVAEGESFQVYTHDATNPDGPSETIDLTTPTQVMVTGTNQILRLEFSDGRVLRCTPNHRLWTANRGRVRADDLVDSDQVRLLDQDIDFGMASWAMPVSTDPASYMQRKSSRKYRVNLPEKWTDEFAHYLGWLIGDGSVTADTVVTVYGTSEEQQSAMILHRELLTDINGGFALKPTKMGNGTYQLRIGRMAFRRFVEALGVSRSKADEKRVPWSIFEAPKPIVAAFLRGLYDADGCARYGDTTRYVGLASASKEMLRDVQQLLDTFGIHGSIYSSKRKQVASFEYVTKDGEARTYRGRSEINDLRVMGSDIERFYESIGFGLSMKDDILHQMLVERTRYATKHSVHLKSRSEDGWETTYNLTEPRNHSYITLGILTSNCSEYLFLDDTACNLASLNLVTFYDDATGVFDVEAYLHAIRLWTIVLEISVAMAHFPSREIAQGSYDYRTLGLGYANLGSLLMRQGIAYDSDEGRAIAGGLTAILTGHSYATSAEIASVVGPFPRFAENRESMLRVMRNHRRAAWAEDDYEGVTTTVMNIDPELCPDDLLSAARQSWDLALELGEKHGYRNAQATVLAPTGTIGLLMDCDTTGVEPDFALVKFKKLAGGGYFKIVNQTVAPALTHLGYSPDQIKDIVEYIVGTSSLEGAPHINRGSLIEKGFDESDLAKLEAALPSVFELKHAFNVFTFGEETLQRLGFDVDEYTSWDFNLLRALGFTGQEITEANDHICGRQTIEGAPHIADEHLEVFDTANRNGKYGERFIHHNGHILMMAAAQPFISGAISKTINMPEEVTPDDIEDAYRLSWELGLKAMALYRDGSKAAQPLNSTADEGDENEDEDVAITMAVEADKALHWGNLPAGISPSQAYARGMKPPRFLLPARRGGFNQEARVGGHKVYLRTGEYDDGTLGEIFIDLAKEGATLKGILSCFAIAVSKGLQYGVPLDEFVDTFTFQTFEPRGMVEGHPNIKMANSIIDYVFRALGVEYLERDELAQVPPNREGELASPPKGLAIEAGVQLDLTDAAAEDDVEALQRAAAFVDSPEGNATVVVVEKETMLIASGSAAAANAALKENMGDAPVCSNCGHMTIRNGSCYVCLTCGDTTGCS